MTGMTRPLFERYIGIDSSGARTPTSSLTGLRVYVAGRRSPPTEIQPPPGPRKYWTRKRLAEWLVEQVREETVSLVGIDHGFSFPLRYFEAHLLERNWRAFLDEFQNHSSFYVRVHEGGKDRWISLGPDYEVACRKLREIRLGVVEERGLTVEEAVEEYLKVYVPTRRNPYNVKHSESACRKYLIPFLGRYALAKVGKGSPTSSGKPDASAAIVAADSGTAT